MITQFFFLAAITFLLVHEMDAIHCREWAIFPLLSRLPEKSGYLIFTAAHIPLIYLVLTGLAGGAIFLPWVRVSLDIFCLAHVGLHALFHHHPENRFTSFLTWSIILGTGLAGLIDLCLVVF